MGLVVLAIVGYFFENRDYVFWGFVVGAFILGFGTSVMYPNVLAAATENSLPITRASSLGTYRFWRDSGYWIGGLILGVVADETNIPLAIVLTAIFTVLVVIVWFIFYDDNKNKEEELVRNYLEAD